MAVRAKYYEHNIIVSKSYRPLYLISMLTLLLTIYCKKIMTIVEYLVATNILCKKNNILRVRVDSLVAKTQISAAQVMLKKNIVNDHWLLYKENS